MREAGDRFRKVRLIHSRFRLRLAVLGVFRFRVAPEGCDREEAKSRRGIFHFVGEVRTGKFASVKAI